MVALEVDLGDAGGVVGQQRPVVADEDDAGVGAVEEPAEPLQPVEVEVVGRLVEQQHVEAGQQHRGQVDLHLLPTGQLADRPLLNPAGQAEIGQHLRHPHVVVVAAQRQQAGQGSVVGLELGRTGRVLQRRQRGVERRFRHGQAGAPPKVGGSRFPFERIDLLGEVPDGERRRRPLYRPRRWGLEAGQDAQQRRLPRAVAAQHPDAAAGVDRQVDPVEHHPRAAHHRHVPGCEHRLRLKAGP